MFNKPFHHRLPQRIRTWNVRYDLREEFGHIRLSRLAARRRRRKPPKVRRALLRAWKMRNWGALFDPDMPF